MNNVDEILKLIDQSIDKINDRIDKKFNNREIETIVDNVVGNKIEEFIVNTAHSDIYKRINTNLIYSIEKKLFSKDYDERIDFIVNEYLTDEHLNNLLSSFLRRKLEEIIPCRDHDF